MYRRNGDPLESQPQYRREVNDEDVVILRLETPDLTQPRNMTTTHMANFVQHPIERRGPPPTPPSGPTMRPPKFEGRSCYTADYIEHPYESPVKDKKPPRAAWAPNDVPMASRSTYAENYPWHNPEPQAKTPRPDRSRTYNNDSVPFKGQTSYNQDYVKHAPQRPKSSQGRSSSRRKEQPPEPVQFSGSTTYHNDYKKHANAQTQRIPPWTQDVAASPPFQGTSEYQKEYIKKQRARQPRIHIEPEDGVRGEKIRSKTSCR